LVEPGSLRRRGRGRAAGGGGEPGWGGGSGMWKGWQAPEWVALGLVGVRSGCGRIYGIGGCGHRRGFRDGTDFRLVSWGMKGFDVQLGWRR
jgi:hypothetical protein